MRYIRVSNSYLSKYRLKQFPHLHWLLTTQIEISLAGKVSLSQSKIRRDGIFPGNTKGTQFPNQKFTTAREQLQAIFFFFFCSMSQYNQLN